MDASHFELNVRISAEAKYAGTLRDLAAHAARYAGCPPQRVDGYAAAVERVVLACIAHVESASSVPVVFRRGGGPLECLVECEGPFDASPGEERVSVSWTRERGTSMCRVALDL